MTETEFFQHLQKLCLPGIWSKGVSLVRSQQVIQDSSQPDEKIFRVQEPGRPVGRKVTLWPQDEDWYCECETQADVCPHVAASVIFLNNLLNRKTTPETSSSHSPSNPLISTPDASPNESKNTSVSLSSNSSEAAPESSATPTPFRSNWLQLSYEFRRDPGGLAIDRYLSGSSQPKSRLPDSLVSYVGGIQSGRIKSLPVATIREDFGIDAILSNQPRGRLHSAVLARLLKSLSGFPNIFLDGKAVQVSTQSVGHCMTVQEEGTGYRLKFQRDLTITEVFQNGAALCGGTLRPMEISKLSPAEQAIFEGAGKYFGPPEVPKLVLELIPLLKTKVSVQILTDSLPEVKLGEPRIVLDLQQGRGPEEETLFVLPALTYATPEEDQGDAKGQNYLQLNSTERPKNNSKRVLYQPNPVAEKQLIRKLQNELQLSLGQTVSFRGFDAVQFANRLQDWQTTGNGLQAFHLEKELEARLDVQEHDFNLLFETPGTSLSAQPKRANAQRVFQAWRENQSFVPLLGGGWAPLPKDWLGRYGGRILSLLHAKESSESPSPGASGLRAKIPPHLIPNLTQLCEEMGNPYPESLHRFKQRLTEVEAIPDSVLPADLKVSLRNYQWKGLNWLCFLRDSQMGALLADDMGLGKTLQAICAIQTHRSDGTPSRTLIIAPTSVLPNWAEQISKFRPQLTYSIFHGSQRTFDLDSHVVVTSYALLRLNREILNAGTWDMIILDEAQTIKNPSSQTAQAAHALQGHFKLALSGTPVENHLRDLWSLFHFLNPGILGTLDEFQETFADPISRGDARAANLLRTQIRPFILRRLKKEVAPELPPRTETVLYCELSASEQELYTSLLASTRKEVLEKLETQGNVFAALELLLRLRQACCHSALVPGELQFQNSLQNSNGTQKVASSSKVQLLVETLEESIELGHRSLIFSQWTSYLDLIQTALDEKGITWLRLDGSTRNRAEIVEQFQTQEKYQTLLISLKAGGTGLNLTAADHVFLMDPWWNPAVEDQAADRAHRIGQENPVLIHRLVAQGTVEERILALQKSKLQMADAVLEGSAASLTKQDLLNLLT